MRTLTVPLNAASPRARLVVADTAVRVALWLSGPETRIVRGRRVHTGAVGPHHAAELGEFLLGCPVPDYEPQDRTWPRGSCTSPPAILGRSPIWTCGSTVAVLTPAPGGPQGLLHSLAPPGSPLLLTALNVPLPQVGEDPAARSGPQTYLGHVHGLGERPINRAPSI
ncbi:hypothetical protein ACFU99_25685 [Streptomyces sp. NPDC057654]|uniref:hypothetical protein n=1 Tax=Streptomyces sp. NPDC057654 TaxID=3346196 RepID=UPI0036B5032F